MAKKWYVLHTQVGKEHKVKTNIENRLKSRQMNGVICQVLVPVETVSEVRTGEKTISERKIFPGYVLIEMELTDETWHFVKSTEGVAKFAGSGKPVPLNESEIGSILKQIAEKKEKPQPRVLFQQGENVKVTDGPFTNFNGVIEEINPERQRVKVLVSIFGRSTPVDLEYWQVEKV